MAILRASFQPSAQVFVKKSQIKFFQKISKKDTDLHGFLRILMRF